MGKVLQLYTHDSRPSYRSCHLHHYHLTAQKYDFSRNHITYYDGFFSHDRNEAVMLSIDLFAVWRKGGLRRAWPILTALTTIGVPSASMISVWFASRSHLTANSSYFRFICTVKSCMILVSFGKCSLRIILTSCHSSVHL